MTWGPETTISMFQKWPGGHSNKAVTAVSISDQNQKFFLQGFLHVKHVSENNREITWNNIYLGDEWKQSGNGWKITECMWLYCRHQVTLMYQRCQQHVSGQQNYLFTKARHTTIVRFPCPCYEHFLSIANP